jgi:VanZ family protein
MRALRWPMLWWGGATSLVAVTCWLALRPSSGGEPWFDGADKFQHVVAFLALTAWFLALVERSRYSAVVSAMLAFGALIELAQHLMPYGRQAEWADMAADALGIALGLALSLAIRDSWLQRVERLLAPAGTLG